MRFSYLISAFIGGVAGSLFIRIGDAAPGDVFGSPHVALTSYQNSQGHFTLWSDGHITDVHDNRAVINNALAYDDAPQFRRQVPQGPGVQGSPNVPVSLVQTGDGTFVLFTDGSVRRPQDPRARAARSGPSDFRWVNTNQSGVKITGSSSISTSRVGEGHYRITFDPPFQYKPCVVASASDTRYYCGVGAVNASSAEIFTLMLHNANTYPRDSPLCIFVGSDEVSQ